MSKGVTTSQKNSWSVITSKMVCKNICYRFRVTKDRRGSYYAQGFKRCQVCQIFIEWNGTKCPCCHINLRTRPRTSLAFSDAHQWYFVLLLLSFVNFCLNLLQFALIKRLWPVPTISKIIQAPFMKQKIIFAVEHWIHICSITFEGREHQCSLFFI